MPYFVSWFKDGRTTQFAHPHIDRNSALDFACEAFKIGASDVWVVDENGQKVADQQDVAQHADKTGKPYN